ncbi:MAG: group II intron reverse transcriptase/maturase [Cytophagaceae bacterium]
MKENITKSLPVSKEMVYRSYLNVKSKDGSAGIDKESIEGFDANLSGNLYKIWNRMSSGSYFPLPVRRQLIPKKQGGTRPLGIPTVSDRIAQGVVKDYLEPTLESCFHQSSFGYRPGRSAHNALEQCKRHCEMYSWVIDLDIKGFFDNINHEKLLAMVKYHNDEKWVSLYVQRWLKAGVEQEDGSIAERTKGTPQGGVISPLLANIYLHHGFDKWMEKYYQSNPFERYADDIVIHCRSKEEAQQLLERIKERLLGFDLELHPEKTKIVYCKDDLRKGNHTQESFTFLSYSFQPRSYKTGNKAGKKMKILFSAAISNAAKTSIREAIRKILNPNYSTFNLEYFAEKLNPKLRGWYNYYSKYNKWVLFYEFRYLNKLIRRWIRTKYKLYSKNMQWDKYKCLLKLNPSLFYHWKLGIG